MPTVPPQKSASLNPAKPQHNNHPDPDSSQHTTTNQVFQIHASPFSPLNFLGKFSVECV
jgi:hypothetical protein